MVYEKVKFEHPMANQQSYVCKKTYIILLYEFPREQTERFDFSR